MSDENVEDVDGEEITDLSNELVITKYQDAAKIVNLTIKGIVEKCLPGVHIIELCKFGTSIIETSTSRLYAKKKDGVVIERGVSFPVCISVNDVVCNHSPLPTETLEPLKAGDCVKIDLGCHIDGYIAVAAHTVIVPESPVDDAPTPEPVLTSPELGKVAVAAYETMLVAAYAIKAGAKNSDVTSAVERVTKAYGVSPISSVRMHQMKRFVMDGVKEVALKEYVPDDVNDVNERVPPCEFEQYEVYAVDVALSTGDGKARIGELRTTVFKRNVEVNYKLKMKSSRALLSQVDRKYPALPFTLRNFEDERTAKMGVTECSSHGLLIPYPSLHEKHGCHVAHFKCTVLILPSGTTRICGLDLPEYFKTDVEADDETKRILEEIRIEEERRAKKKASKKKKKKKGKGEAANPIASS